MGAKPPILPVVKGISSAPTPKAVTAKVPEPPANAPLGDVLLLKVGGRDKTPHPTKHEVSIYERTDPTQFTRYLARCTCGGEMRSHGLEAVKMLAFKHLSTRGVSTDGL